MAAPPPLRADEVLRVLRVLAPVTADPSVVLVGGQAVGFWARFLSLDTADSSAELLASKDIDFEGSADAARAAADLLGGRSRVPSFDHHTPLTGFVFFDDSDGIDPFEAILADDDRLPSAFRGRRYPQMREQLSRIRQI